MRAHELAEIKALPLFVDMKDESFESLFRGAYVQNFPPQVDLIHEGEPADFLHVVVEGEVELFAAWNGRETTMATVRPISTFILAATVKDAPYLMSGRTTARSRVILIPSVDVRAVFEADGAFARAIVNELAQCYRTVVKQSKNIKLRTSIERLANYLLRHHRAQQAPAHFELGIEKRRLASYLGMTPENLSRAFKNLEDYGVSVNGATITISDAAALERLAKPHALIDDYNC